MRVIFRQKRATSESRVCICFSDDSHLCIDPDECGLSPADRSQEMSGSVQQIIDKYSKELNASLRHAGVHSGKHHKYGVCICAEHTHAHVFSVQVQWTLSVSPGPVCFTRRYEHMMETQLRSQVSFFPLSSSSLQTGWFEIITSSYLQLIIIIITAVAITNLGKSVDCSTEFYIYSHGIKDYMNVGVYMGLCTE